MSNYTGKTLSQWLSYLENLHHSEIDLGLMRIKKVASEIQLDAANAVSSSEVSYGIDFSFAKVITVAGTNGKGTTCAFLENALLAEHKSVAVYSSPHIESFNERLRINKINVDDTNFISAFELIEKHRGDTSLTYYEYTSLAAFIVLQKIRPDIIILEVGLGGRLDATNMIDADIAVVTTVDLDHQSFLGDNRESIGFEKAGIARSDKPLVVGDINVPNSVIKHANNIGADLCCRSTNFFVELNKKHWQWQFNQQKVAQLTKPYIPIDNVATALTVLALLDVELTRKKVNQLIANTKVIGRLELFSASSRKSDMDLPCCGDIILDVGHNPQASRYLAAEVASFTYNRVFAVTGMLMDKDVKNTLQPLNSLVDEWFVAKLSTPRSVEVDYLEKSLLEQGQKVNCFDNITQAFRMACQEAASDDLVLVFGSFFTVAEVRRLLTA